MKKLNMLLLVVVAQMMLGIAWEPAPLLAGAEFTPTNSSASLVSSYANTIFQLAGERFEEDLRSGKHHIWAIHDWSKNPKPLKYSAGEFMVVSVPASSDEVLGLCKFASSYNTWAMHSADVMAKKGAYDRALAYYRFLRKFDSCGDLVSPLTERIACVEAMQKGGETEKNRQLLDSLIVDLSLLGMVEVADTPVTTVSDLNTVTLPALKREKAIE